MIEKQKQQEQQTVIQEERKPTIITKYFMADWISEDRREGTPAGWCVYRLSDFLNPSLPDGPNSLYMTSSESDVRVRAIMARLDDLYDETIRQDTCKALALEFVKAGDVEAFSDKATDELSAYVDDMLSSVHTVNDDVQNVDNE